MNVVENQELSGVIKLEPGYNAFIGCHAGIEPPTMDCSCEGASLTMVGFTGHVTLQNKTGPEPVRINLMCGNITLDKSSTGGNIEISGVLEGLPIISSENFFFQLSETLTNITS